MIHKIQHGQFVNIIGNKRNYDHPISVQIASQIKDEFYHPKPGEPERAWLIAHAICIHVNPERNFGKSKVNEIDVHYGDIFDTPQGFFRLDQEPLSDGKLVLIRKSNHEQLN